ncbi:hypothetical protein KRR38_18630 [Novosphingobium sp. G106]|uniref:hypothetical protein n=1 Tax=Novosphingobium sp. G106 TaxID=2849500 RepID=UPI001C2D523E|nr:hypothetical protein [Novosphingobium sp. G106]MBV1689644.1 hypothetical protein [Novosphingobium sp. G106]
MRGDLGGTDISFGAEAASDLKYWFGSDNPKIARRLSAFAKTGSEGSLAAFWLADDGSQKIVHMGSGSGSTMACVLADDPVDFLRLIAIGYDEICWGSEFAKMYGEDTEHIIGPNDAFADWVMQTFDVSIPRRGIEIVKSLAFTGDPDSSDPFWQWVEKVSD